MKQRLTVLAVVVVCGLGVAACGSSHKSSSNSASSKSSGKSASTSGTPIKLMVIGTISSPQFSIPSIPLGAEIAVSEINSSGGVDGHKLDLITCNDQNSPNTAEQCGREAIRDKVDALVGGLEDYDLEIEPSLVSAHIPWVGLTTPDDYTSANLFLFPGQGVDAYAAAGLTLAQRGCKKEAIIVTSASGTQKINIADLSAGIHAGGATIATTITIPATQVDMASTAEAVRTSGAQCIAGGVSPTQSGPLITALNTGAKLPYAEAAGGLPEQVIAQLGKSANGVLATAGFLPASSTVGAVPALVKEMEAKYPKVPFDNFVETGYASVRLVAQAIKGLGNNISSSSIMAAVGKISNFNTEVGPVVSSSGLGSIPGFPRLFSAKDYVYTAKDGNYQLDHPQPIDTTAALKLVAAAK